MPDAATPLPATRAGSRAVRLAVLWLALCVAFSPVLLDFWDHVTERAWARYALLFPPLFVWAALCERGTGEPASSSRTVALYGVVAAGLLIELVALANGVVRVGRIGLLMAAVGLCRVFGVASLACAALLLWAIPVPSAALNAVGSTLPSLHLRAAGAVASGVGLPVTIEAKRAAAGEQTLALNRWDSGLTLAALLSGLVWYRGVRRGRRPVETALRAGVAAVAALPLQTLAVLGALGVLALGAGEAARAFLTDGLWIATAALGIASTEWSLRPGREAADGL